jgi:hypothetical protein
VTTSKKSLARNEVNVRNGLPQAEAPPSPPAGPYGIHTSRLDLV